jgi:hypothetical protein
MSVSVSPSEEVPVPFTSVNVRLGPEDRAGREIQVSDLEALLQDLARQSNPLWPDVPIFSRRANSLLALLSTLSR